jgi:hypothetical protein
MIRTFTPLRSKLRASTRPDGPPPTFIWHTISTSRLQYKRLYGLTMSTGVCIVELDADVCGLRQLIWFCERLVVANALPFIENSLPV